MMRSNTRYKHIQKYINLITFEDIFMIGKNASILNYDKWKVFSFTKKKKKTTSLSTREASFF